MRLAVFMVAAFGILVAIQTAAIHLQADPLADVRAYYDAGARLNAGLGLYDQAAGTNDAEFYRYPPLLAIMFRPLALLPFEVAAAIWEGVVVGAFALTLRRIGLDRRALVAIGLLGLPIGWSLAIGQAQVPVTLLMTLGSPWALALATHMKILPALAAIWWLGRRDWPSLGRFMAWTTGLTLLQLILEPRGSLAFLSVFNLEQVGAVRNFSPYAISPALWLALVLVGTIAAVRLAPTRYGWFAAVALAVLATPRLLTYQLMSLLAGLREPDPTPATPAVAVPAPARSVA
ncbi:MAG: glycosyltransferase 87 family protein [Chloroflexota bacterium]|nr:glycosyltransferase 87 family protein [Chloroflexota bacterium]